MEQRLKIPGRDILGYLLLGISTIMLCKSLTLCFSNDIWYDELFTVGMIEHSYGDLIAFTARDVHPPLYYCIVKFVVELCKLVSARTNPVAVAKIVSVLPYFILLVYSATFIRKRFGMLVGGLFLFCSIAMPQLSSYTVEVRMYSWALLFVTAAFLHGYGTVSAGGVFSASGDLSTGRGLLADVGLSAGRSLPMNVDLSVRGISAVDAADGERCRIRRAQKRHGAALVLYGLAAAYTQYFACVAVIMVYLFVLIAFWRRDRSRIKEWLLWVALSILGYLPWLYVLYRQITAVRDNYWILPLTWRSLGGCVKFLMKPAFADETLNTVLAVVMSVLYAAVVGYVAFSPCIARYGKENPKLSHNGREIGSLYAMRHPATDGEELSEISANTRNDKNDVVDTVFEENSRQVCEKKPLEMHSESVFEMIVAGIGVLAGLVLFGFAASMILRPIFVYRYMLPAMGCFWLSFALGVGSLFDDELCKPTKALMNFWGERSGGAMVEDASISALKIPVAYAVLLFILVVGLRDYRAFMGEEEYKIRLMAETEEALSAITSEDVVLYNFDQVQAVTSYYLDRDTDSYLWCGMPETLVQEIVRPYDTVEETGKIRAWCEAGRNVWFLGSFNSREDVVAEWRDAGLEIEEVGSYLLERYWFNLYKIS